MILIADSGSTTTEWRLIDGERISQFQSIGLNPYIVDDKEISETISALNLPVEGILKLYFYGAGCGSAEKVASVFSVLKALFSNAEVFIYSDLLAAARSLLQHEEGVIGILGTGSNVAHYSNPIVKPFTTSTGYLLGDEGSGNALGKRLLRAFLKDELDDELTLKIGSDKSVILHQLYNHSYPNRYLASYAKMMFRNRNHPQIAQLIQSTFDEWVENCLLPYEIKDIALCGSIAYYFHSELKRSCASHGIRVKSVIEKPIAALALYHKAYE
jgi:glucosamine kinase